jgi:hypothetical protein
LDYGEREDLFRLQPAIAVELQQSMSRFVSEQEKDRDPQPVTTVPNIDAMKALGYIE